MVLKFMEQNNYYLSLINNNYKIHVKGILTHVFVDVQKYKYVIPNSDPKQNSPANPVAVGLEIVLCVVILIVSPSIPMKFSLVDDD